MNVAYVSEDFESKRDFKKAVEAGRKLVVTSKRPDPLAPPSPGPFTGTLLIQSWWPTGKRGLLGGDWSTKADIRDGIVIRVR
jgi:hypothetical protein